MNVYDFCYQRGLFTRLRWFYAWLCEYHRSLPFGDSWRDIRHPLKTVVANLKNKIKIMAEILVLPRNRGAAVRQETKAAKFSTILPILESNRKWNWLESAKEYIYSLVTLQQISGKCICVCDGVIHNSLMNVSSFSLHVLNDDSKLEIGSLDI